MTVSSLALWIVAVVLLTVAVRAFQAVDPPQSSRRSMLLLIVPLSTLVSIYAQGGWIQQGAWGVISFSLVLLGACYRYILARDAQDQARNRFDSLDPETKEKFRERARTLPFHRRRLEKLFGTDEKEKK